MPFSQRAARPHPGAPEAAGRRLRRLPDRPLQHSLQTATLAQRDGRDEEYVVCALLHDIGDTLGCFNHPDIAAAILKPFVSEANHWMVQNHGIFQGYYFFHHLGMNRDMREQFRGHAHYERTEEFFALYDSPAFDAEGARRCRSASSSRCCGACSRSRATVGVQGGAGGAGCGRVSATMRIPHAAPWRLSSEARFPLSHTLCRLATARPAG